MQLIKSTNQQLPSTGQTIYMSIQGPGGCNLVKAI
jgi:hypothetical protein